MWTYFFTSNPTKKKSSLALVYYKSTAVRRFNLHMLMIYIDLVDVLVNFYNKQYNRHYK